MVKRCVNTGAVKFALLFLALGQAAAAQRSAASGDVHWVATWASAQQVPRPAPIARTAAPAGAPAAANGPALAAAPPAAAVPPPAPRPARSFNNQTLRMVMRTSIGGEQLRVHLSNAFGTVPLTVGTAHVALWSKDSAIVAGSDRALTFNGRPGVTIRWGPRC